MTMSSLNCVVHQACAVQNPSQADFYCFQCRSLQCKLCEKIVHKNAAKEEHLRLNLNKINDECCAVNPRHPAIFYCPSCTATFCLSCWISEHQRGDEKKHLPQKFLDDQIVRKEIDEIRNSMAEKSLYPDLPLTDSNPTPKPSAPAFDDIQTSNSDRHLQSQENSNGVVFLLNDAEQFNIKHAQEFIRQLKADSQDPYVKCVSIVGNTGEGKSFTLNRIFFNGEEKFGTSSRPESCTMGVWAALDAKQRTLVLDTEGRLGLTMNDNARNRLLLKVMCVSDIVIYRTRAPKLTDDMFRFLSDASNVFLKFFQKELENIMKNSKSDGTVSTKGPILVVSHETQHTEILKDDLQKTAVQQLKERFEKMGLSYSAYQSMEYVGVQSLGEKRVESKRLKSTIRSLLENNDIRSPRRLSVIFKALKALNEKFSHTIPPEMPSILPDEFFTCCVRCLSCERKCTLPANHEKENMPHLSNHLCIYNPELDNETMKCIRCDREGLDTNVFGKLIARNDSLIQGFVRYVWSGFVIECPKHGEIYRSRKYWYGNHDPKTVTRIQIVHAWPGDDSNRIGNDVTPRKVIEALRNATSYISASAVPIKETIADQLAPAYWVPNRDAHDCYACKLQFGTEFSKHHCRACGYVFCDACTSHRAIVPLLDSAVPERVCNECYEKIQSKTLTFQNSNPSAQQLQPTEDTTNPNNAPEQGFYASNAYNIPMSRRILELVQNNISSVVYEYPKTWINQGTRPNYWRSDDECKVCFICQHPFNTTTHRLHHCRKCGEGVCDECSPNKLPVPERDWLTPERVCKNCEIILKNSTADKE